MRCGYRILMLQRFFMGFESKDTAVMRFVKQNAGDAGVGDQIVSKMEVKVTSRRHDWMSHGAESPEQSCK